MNQNKPITDYEQFLLNKSQLAGNFGFEPSLMPDKMFDFQKYVTDYVIKKGRSAGFIDTGLGKTIIELAVAKNHVVKSNKPTLILTPLAVAHQFLKEAEKFGIDDVCHTKDGNYKNKIVLCNYERLNKLNWQDFDCVICDESSILKNFDGVIKSQVTSFMRKIKYRYLFTATPSPNDFIELGTSSEALGYLGYTDMLTKFFTNNEDTISPQNIGTKWILKGHATDNFFKWVSGWSISMRKPSDLGFDDSRFILPKLTTNYHSVFNSENLVVNGQIQMFNQIARSMPEVQDEQRKTIKGRCEKAVELASLHEKSVYWCNLNPEGDLLKKIDKDSYQITGSMSLEKKEDILLAFANGEINKLITKAKMTAFGLNWQHCNHTVYFPDFSYEKYYQAIRRFWRFGQKREVICDMVHSDGQKRVLDSLIAKTEKADQLFSKLNSTLHQNFNIDKKEFDKQITLPTFLK